jgi:hypothetical protein
MAEKTALEKMGERQDGEYQTPIFTEPNNPGKPIPKSPR